MSDAERTRLVCNTSGDLVPNDLQIERLNKCLEWCKLWRDRLGIHRDWNITLQYGGDTDSLMVMDDSLAFYNSFLIVINDSALEDPDFESTEKTCLHELLHIVMWSFRKFCTTVAINDFQEAVELREESVINQLELAFARAFHLLS